MTSETNMAMNLWQSHDKPTLKVAFSYYWFCVLWSWQWRR